MIAFKFKDCYNVDDLAGIIAILRSENGCPWDIEQTHESIRRNLLEEAYEACEAIDEGDTAHLCEELGDVLMQVLFHSRIEEESGGFTIDDVADAACKKLIHRHPHVFGGVPVKDSAEVLLNWDELKLKERSQTNASSAMDSVAKSLPSLWRAEKIQGRAKKAGFDWPDISGAFSKLEEEVIELRDALKSGDGMFEELGDLLFSAVNVARFLDIDPEEALHASCEKFISRFKFIEAKARSLGRELDRMTLSEMDELYELAKMGENSN